MTTNQNTTTTKCSEVGPSEEYKTLREEMLQAKKYVFERPLLIAAIATAGSRGLDREFLFLLLVLAAGLLLFNFWFTTNRLSSGARITAYIQLEIEERSHGRWVGWETCLREYRRWQKNDSEEMRQEIDKAIDKAAIPDALMFYRPIYLLHVGLMAVVVFVALTLAVRSPSWLAILSALFVVSFAACLAAYLCNYAPSTMKALIERNRVIWTLVLTKMQADGLK